jgi:hypothetical protein
MRVLFSACNQLESNVSEFVQGILVGGFLLAVTQLLGSILLFLILTRKYGRDNG